jgi:hypothetical protein
LIEKNALKLRHFIEWSLRNRRAVRSSSTLQ